MECEMDNCFEPAVTRRPVLGLLRHVCQLHAGGLVADCDCGLPLEDAVGLLQTLEYYETRQHLEGPGRALGDYQQLATTQPVTLARAMKIVLDRPPTREEAGDIQPVPF